jgi:hypothetical protein
LFIKNIRLIFVKEIKPIEIMIHTEQDFFNKVAKEIDTNYFPLVKYYRDDENCTKVHYTLELFNNGCLTYRQLIGRLSKSCNDTTEKIHSIVSKYVISFGSYEYKPNKTI